MTSTKQNKDLITKPSEEEINEIRRFTGENDFNLEGRKINYINFHGKDGEYLMASGEKNEDGSNKYESLGKEIKVVIFRIRRMLQTKKEASNDLYSSEFDSYNEDIEIYEKGNKELVAIGRFNELKSQFTELKLNNLAYVYFNDALYKIQITGGSLNPFWNYLQSFKGDDTVFRYNTIMGTKSAVSKEGFKYQQMTFQKGKEVENWKEIWEEVKQLNHILTKSVENKIPEAKQEDKELPVIDVNEQKDEIKIEDLPF